MTTRRARRGSATGRLLAGTVIGAGAIAVTSVPASAATTATFNAGVLTVIGDSTPNDIQISRDAAGRILVNDGGVTVAGDTPTVANTSQIRVLGLAGDDVLNLNETNGALPAAHLFGGADNDALTGGAGADKLFGQPATTPCSVGAAMTSCSAAARTTRSSAATPTTKHSARVATTS